MASTTTQVDASAPILSKIIGLATKGFTGAVEVHAKVSGVTRHVTVWLDGGDIYAIHSSDYTAPAREWAEYKLGGPLPPGDGEPEFIAYQQPDSPVTAEIVEQARRDWGYGILTTALTWAKPSIKVRKRLTTSERKFRPSAWERVVTDMNARMEAYEKAWAQVCASLMANRIPAKDAREAAPRLVAVLEGSSIFNVELPLDQLARRIGATRATIVIELSRQLMMGYTPRYSVATPTDEVVVPEMLEDPARSYAQFVDQPASPSAAATMDLTPPITPEPLPPVDVAPTSAPPTVMVFPSAGMDGAAPAGVPTLGTQPATPESHATEDAVAPFEGYITAGPDLAYSDRGDAPALEPQADTRYDLPAFDPSEFSQPTPEPAPDLTTEALSGWVTPETFTPPGPTFGEAAYDAQTPPPFMGEQPPPWQTEAVDTSQFLTGLDALGSPESALDQTPAISEPAQWAYSNDTVNLDQATAFADVEPTTHEAMTPPAHVFAASDAISMEPTPWPTEAPETAPLADTPTYEAPPAPTPFIPAPTAAPTPPASTGVLSSWAAEVASILDDDMQLSIMQRVRAASLDEVSDIDAQQQALALEVAKAAEKVASARAELDADNALLQRALTILEERRTALADAVAAHEAKKQQAEQVRQAQTEAEGEVTAEQAHLEELLAEVARAQVRLEAARATVTAITEQVKQVEAELAHATEPAVRAAEAALQAHQAQVVEPHTAEVQSAEAALAQAQAAHANTQAEYENLSTRKDRLSRLLATLTGRA